MGKFNEKNDNNCRILFVTGDLANDLSGPMHSMKMLAEALNSRGYEITILGTLDKGKSCSTLLNKYTIVPFQSKIFKSFHYSFLMALYLRGNSHVYGHISVQGVWLAALFALLCLREVKGQTITIFVHGNFSKVALNINKIKKKILLTFIKLRQRRISSLVALTQHEKNLCSELFPNIKTVVIPNGLKKIERAQELSCRSNSFTFIGRIHQIKGLERTISGWANANLKDWTFNIFGDGESVYVEKIKKHILESQVSNVNLFPPIFDEKKSKILRETRFLVLFSYTEAFPMVLLEALAAGALVVSSTQSSAHEVVGHDTNLILTSEVTINEISRLLEYSASLTPEELTEEYEKQGKLIKNFDIDNICSEYERLLSVG